MLSPLPFIEEVKSLFFLLGDSDNEYMARSAEIVQALLHTRNEMTVVTATSCILDAHHASWLESTVHAAH